MKPIASFTINHDLLKPGMYVSRVDGDIVTYDIRMVPPNTGVYLDNDQIHTFEHLFATYARNSASANDIIYFGPMGCRTGFYLLTRDTLSKHGAIALVQQTLEFIAQYQGEIPGASQVECGNYLDHNLPKAVQLANDMLPVLAQWTRADLAYPQ